MEFVIDVSGTRDESFIGTRDYYMLWENCESIDKIFLLLFLILSYLKERYFNKNLL